MIQGSRGLGSTGGKHRTEGVLVRGTEPSLGSIDRECRASGVSVELGKPQQAPESRSTQDAKEESSEGVYISTFSQLSIGKLELLRSQAVLNYIPFTAPFTLLPHCLAT